MKRIYTKLFLTLTALVVSLVMVVTVSFAWMTLSNNPIAEGIQITIAGGNTILVAADQAKEVDGTIYHYPGQFNGTISFNPNSGYGYLSNLSNLTPVSTADGINWFIPTYYDLMDPEVQEGTVLSGTMKSWDKFENDKTLLYANLDQSNAKKASKGSYIYLDFWVVSPGADYTLRVSTGKDSGGSYVIGLPEAVENELGGYNLSSAGNTADACVRVGLLANPNYITDNTMWYYQDSSAYSSQYTKLRGDYQEPGESIDDTSDYHFAIYEPNADLHPTISKAQGNYLATRPLGLSDSVISPVDINSSLTVQTQSTWTVAQTGSGTQLEQRFQAAALEPSFSGLTVEEMTQKFYNEYLQAQVGPYVTKGVFVKNTANLYSALDSNGIADGSYLGEGYTANATDDAYIVVLEKNVPQRIRMFIWIEGQDADCVNSAEAASFAFRIELAGSHDGVETQTSPVTVLTLEDTQTDTNSEQEQDDSETQTEDSITEEETSEHTEEEVTEDETEENTEGQIIEDVTEENTDVVEESQSETLNDTEVEDESQNE